MELYIQYFFLALTLLGAVLVLVCKNVLYAALSLFFSFLGIAALYVFEGADFLAITQLIVYIGGILVLILFGIMLTNRVKSVKDLTSGSSRLFISFLIATFLFLTLVIGINSLDSNIYNSSFKEKSIITNIGLNLLTENILMFEIIGVLLLVVLVGVAYLISPKSEKK